MNKTRGLPIASNISGLLVGGAIVVSLINIVMDVFPDAQALAESGLPAATQSIYAAVVVSAISFLFLHRPKQGTTCAGYQLALMCQASSRLFLLLAMSKPSPEAVEQSSKH